MQTERESHPPQQPRQVLTEGIVVSLKERHAAGQSLPEGMGLTSKEQSVRIEATVVRRLMAVVMQRFAGSSLWSMSSDGDGGVSAGRHIGQVLCALA